MAALVYAYPEPEGPARAWARSLNLAGIGARFFFGMPASPVFPLGLISLISSVPVRGVPWRRAVMQFDLLGAAPVAGQRPTDKYALGVIANALADAAANLVAGTVVAPGVVCMGAEVENGPVWAPDRGDGRSGQKLDGRSRYTTDIEFLLRLA